MKLDRKTLAEFEGNTDADKRTKIKAALKEGHDPDLLAKVMPLGYDGLEDGDRNALIASAGAYALACIYDGFAIDGTVYEMSRGQTAQEASATPPIVPADEAGKFRKSNHFAHIWLRGGDKKVTISSK